MCKNTEATTRGVLWKMVFLEIFQSSQENTCTRVCFLIKLQGWALQLYEKETLVEVFSCEFCEISKNTFFHRTPLVVASRNDIFIYKIIQVDQIKIYTSLFSWLLKLKPKIMERFDWKKKFVFVFMHYLYHKFSSLNSQDLSPLSVNPTKWSNTCKQFFSVLGHFVALWRVSFSLLSVRTLLCKVHSKYNQTTKMQLRSQFRKRLYLRCLTSFWTALYLRPRNWLTGTYRYAFRGAFCLKISNCK